MDSVISQLYKKPGIGFAVYNECICNRYQVLFEYNTNLFQKSDESCRSYFDPAHCFGNGKYQNKYQTDRTDPF